ncbi:hypothetical protein [Pseudomonas aeruginosa]|uniref:hypothetical protein n=3 Tax=Pseudomonas aeruginosa TaxID=287 RepID=UPI00068F5026|nr:hypothetical protein [Pseudomonas aeruginosa]MCG0412608.1 hypothetical protein [Pseudomonas aeruginosa]WNO93252.1 hypothetical protein RPM48_11990 [Pseudomonas aeruginosa]HCF0219615.1 hypothetical protein [Pseudomonas aeruginosa]HCF0291666.1 hypothetical protein [Pseudomonas aeruginosa]HCF3075895.1 hypothetical protein [Pseudomonas aeruginosa]
MSKELNKAPVEQAGGDERAAFFKHLIGRHPAHETEIVRVVEHNYAAWKAWRARAALAQPSPTLPPFAEKVLAKLRRFYDCAEDFESGGVDIGRHWLDLLTQLGLLNRVQRSPALWEISQQGEDLLGTPHPSPAPADEKPGDSILCSGCFAKGVGPEHFDEAGKCLVRQQTEPLGAEFAQVLSDNLPELLSTAQAEQAVAERPEVVAYADPVAFATFKERGHEGGVAGREWMWAEPGAALVAMSRTDECERIVGALREQYECNTAIMHARTEALSRVTSERDAALSRVAELEKQEPVATVAKVPGEDWNSLDFHRDLQDMQPGTKLYAAPLAQAQQLHDLDKQCRDDVARALGLRPNKERGFAWSYLLASIKSCVKASGDSAQAQHSVPEGWKLVPVEPTEDVLEAIHNGGYVGDDQELRWFYQSILAAAPAPGGE